jgi:acyl dehydratase
MPASTTENALTTTMAELLGQAGRKLGPTDWQAMPQDRVNQFADLTNDHNFIHVDPERARQTPFRGTIAHGYLTLAMLGPISQQLVKVTDARTSINYGLNKVRFPAPLPVGAEFRGQGEVVETTEIDGGVQLTAAFTIEVEGASKPALVAECLFRYYR